MNRPIIVRSRPVQALQYRPDLNNCEAFCAFTEPDYPFDGCNERDHDNATWSLPDGREVGPGEWAVKTVAGLRIMHPDVFDAEYVQSNYPETG